MGARLSTLGASTRMPFFNQLKPYFNACPLISYVCEGLSQTIPNQLKMQKNLVSIFLTMKATIFDTHSRKLVIEVTFSVFDKNVVQ